jgi:hypothetical protein
VDRTDNEKVNDTSGLDELVYKLRSKFGALGPASDVTYVKGDDGNVVRVDRDIAPEPGLPVVESLDSGVGELDVALDGAAGRPEPETSGAEGNGQENMLELDERKLGTCVTAELGLVPIEDNENKDAVTGRDTLEMSVMVVVGSETTFVAMLVMTEGGVVIAELEDLLGGFGSETVNRSLWETLGRLEYNKEELPNGIECDGRVAKRVVALNVVIENMVGVVVSPPRRLLM